MEYKEILLSDNSISDEQIAILLNATGDSLQSFVCTGKSNRVGSKAFQALIDIQKKNDLFFTIKLINITITDHNAFVRFLVEL